MTSENDGVPPTEAAAHRPDDAPLDPPTELLPLDAATAKKVAADDAAARQAEMDTPATADQATQVLPLDHQAAPPTPPPDPNTPTHGTLEGDLFDDQAEPEQ